MLSWRLKVSKQGRMINVSVPSIVSTLILRELFLISVHFKGNARRLPRLENKYAA